MNKEDLKKYIEGCIEECIDHIMTNSKINVIAYYDGKKDAFQEILYILK